MKILIVDDNDDNITLLETLLRKSGFEVVSAGNGIDAIEKLRKDSIGMIVSDILMPGMDGFQFCRVCKKDDSLMKIPFVFYTATYTDKKDDEFALNMGAEKFLIKPLEPGKLLDTLKTVIEDHRNALPVTPKTSIEDEEVYLAEYNKRLVMKLEQKVLDLEKEMDIRRQMEEDIIKAQKLESLSTLAGGIAHDFNNFLAIILSNVTLTKSYTNSTEDIFENLTYIEEASKGAKDLTKQLASFSRGGIPVKKTFSISTLIRESVTLALSGSAVNCEFYLSGDIWLVDADKGQMKQVISNLIINAEQAMTEGGIIKVDAENINVTAKDPLPLSEGKYVKVSIEDQGTGISQEHQQKIFDPYYTTKVKGSGLGLATTYSIINKHNGHIAVESEIGVGTTFHFYLPAMVESEGT